MAIYSYQRTSTKKQETQRQAFEISKTYKIDRTFEDKESGKSMSNRQALKDLMTIAVEGDTVVVSELSRLARNLKDAIEIFDFFVAKGVRVICIREAIDTKASTYKLILGIFGSIAEMQREEIVEKINQTAEYTKQNGGITPKGKKWGRAKKEASELPKNFVKYYNQMIAGDITKVEMASLLKITRQGLYKWLKLYEEEKSKEYNY